MADFIWAPEKQKFYDLGNSTKKGISPHEMIGIVRRLSKEVDGHSDLAEQCLRTVSRLADYHILLEQSGAEELRTAGTDFSYAVHKRQPVSYEIFSEQTSVQKLTSEVGHGKLKELRISVCVTGLPSSRTADKLMRALLVARGAQLFFEAIDNHNQTTQK